MALDPRRHEPDDAPSGGDTPPTAGIAWQDVEAELLSLAAADLADGREPRPTLAAHAGDRPVAIVGLRPFGPGGAVTALIEVLALLLPLGADRLAFLAPARVWSSQDPIPPVCDEGDLRQRALAVITADAHRGACLTTTSVHPFSDAASPADLSVRVVRWEPALRAECGDGPVPRALETLLEARHDIRLHDDDQQLTTQFARVLLLGHDLALAQGAADRLTALASPTLPADPGSDPGDPHPGNSHFGNPHPGDPPVP